MNKFDSFFNSYSKYSGVILRLSIGIVFLYFGWTSLVTPMMWSSYVPEWTTAMIGAETLVRLHGIMEIALGILLVAGIFTRVVALVLFLDLLHILTLLDFGPVWMRDLGLAGAVLSIILMPIKNKEEVQ